eukprot:CAMPEP_0183331184 /NCGR_PEP_ID=MMETSP0164_2-20130417/587_1 /TAXON_ID=221442 /ORGANISM="Coccolithus pelagicus ssp braarudi, Strain PLY182g" /LENGTH=74 /DNA_ID=CAMNT_0025499589 /DNA_START=128 /DNA_END=352 /DNA_ORIENTATION=+
MRYMLTFSSMLTGASFVHWHYQPDLRVPEPASSSPRQNESIDGFVSAPSFTGSRPGFVFKAGPVGLGYYPDTKQ